jgi:hypothetical protein
LLGGDSSKVILVGCSKGKVISILFMKMLVVNTQCAQQQKQQFSSVLQGT